MSCCTYLPLRYILSVYVVIGLMSCYLMRVSVNLALNEITFKLNTKEAGSSGGPKGTICPADAPKFNKTKDKAEYHWDQETQHNIIKAIYIGYIAAHLPAGILADKFGAKQVFGAGILLSSIISLTIPTLARLGPWAFMGGRVIQGFGQGVIFPSMSSLIAKWAPPNERATMGGIVQSGVMLGNAVGYIVSGVLLSALPSWETMFYIYGFLGLLWCSGWYGFCYSSPAEHHYISDKERNMIQTQIAFTTKVRPDHIPWVGIMTSLPFLSLIMVNFSHDWLLFTVVNEMPNYMGKVLQFDIEHSGLYSATPHIVMFPSSIIFGYVSDWINKNNYMGINMNRKVFSILANILPVPFMLLASYAGCDRAMAIFLFMCMMFCNGLAYCSLRINPVDLSPNFAGVLMAIVNGTGAVGGLLSPVFVPMFLTGDGSVEEWRNVFFLTALVLVIFSIPFICLGSGEVQSWNNPPEQTGTEESLSPQSEIPAPKSEAT